MSVILLSEEERETSFDFWLRVMRRKSTVRLLFLTLSQSLWLGAASFVFWIDNGWGINEILTVGFFSFLFFYLIMSVILLLSKGETRERARPVLTFWTLCVFDSIFFFWRYAFEFDFFFFFLEIFASWCFLWTSFGDISGFRLLTFFFSSRWNVYSAAKFLCLILSERDLLLFTKSTSFRLPNLVSVSMLKQ
jgi:hypothetical protein